MPENSTSRPQTPAEVLLNLIITLLAPLFLTAADGDIAFARMAAGATIDDYRTQTHADLITIAQIVAFGVTVLASLSQSMDDDIPLTLALRLRGNANACHRSAEQNRRALKENRREPTTAPPPTPQPEPRRDPHADTAELTAKIAETQKRTAEHPASYTTEAERDRHAHAAWAACAAGIAAETVAGRNDLSPEKRNSGTIWAEALNAFANDLMTSDPPPGLKPGDVNGLVQSGVP